MCCSLQSFHCVTANIYFVMWLPFIECQREKEKKSLHIPILKGDLTINGLEVLYCCHEILVLTTFITYIMYGYLNKNWFLDQNG